MKKRFTIDIASGNQVAGMLDHALLHPTLTEDQLLGHIRALMDCPLASVCVSPCHVVMSAKCLQDVPIKVGTVIGFPHGVTTTETKVTETRLAFDQGADEVDMVVNIGKVVGGQWGDVRRDIAEVLAAARANDGLLKVIFETDFVTDDADKVRLCEVCAELGVDFVKTSTGFGYVKQADGRASYTGATDHDVRLMRKHCPPSVGVKPSGGVKTFEDVMRFYQLGATRFGTTSSRAIVAAARECFGEEARLEPAANQGDQKLEY